MIGARVLGIACLVLAGVVATPTLSVAQEGNAGAEDSGAPPAPLSPPPEAVADPGPPVTEGDDPGKPDPGTPDTSTRSAPSAAAPGGEAEEAAVYVTGDGAKAAASASVSVGDNYYSPASVTVRVGDTISWNNNGQAPHSATADDGSFDTGVFNAGQSRSHTFNSAGSFSYFCTVHGQAQSGTVRVEAAASGGGGGPGSAASGPSEAAAVASPDAAGTDTLLPATGLAALGLALIGLVLLGSGIALRSRGSIWRLHSIY